MKCPCKKSWIFWPWTSSLGAKSRPAKKSVNIVPVARRRWFDGHVILSFRQSLTHSHTHTHTLSLSLSLSLTHTHTHTRHSVISVEPRASLATLPSGRKRSFDHLIVRASSSAHNLLLLSISLHFLTSKHVPPVPPPRSSSSPPPASPLSLPQASIASRHKPRQRRMQPLGEIVKDVALVREGGACIVQRRDIESHLLTPSRPRRR